MAFDTVVRHDTDGSITLLDGTGTPVTIVVPFTQGDLTIDGLSKDLREVVAYQSRGTLHKFFSCAGSGGGLPYQRYCRAYVGCVWQRA